MSPFRDPRLILLLGPTPPCETDAGQLAVAVLLDSSQLTNVLTGCLLVDNRFPLPRDDQGTAQHLSAGTAVGLWFPQ